MFFYFMVFPMISTQPNIAAVHTTDVSKSLTNDTQDGLVMFIPGPDAAKEVKATLEPSKLSDVQTLQFRLIL
jgi:hypothetical protein